MSDRDPAMLLLYEGDLVTQRTIGDFSEVVAEIERSFPFVVALPNESAGYTYDQLIKERDDIDRWLADRGHEPPSKTDFYKGDEFYVKNNPLSIYANPRVYKLDVDCGWAMRNWIWYFKDPDLAFEFKLRWY